MKSRTAACSRIIPTVQQHILFVHQQSLKVPVVLPSFFCSLPFFLTSLVLGKGDNGKKPLSPQASAVTSPEDTAIETAVVKELAALAKTLFLDEGTEPVISPEEVEEEVSDKFI